MEDTKNIVEICKNILCTKAKYFYDKFYSNNLIIKFPPGTWQEVINSDDIKYAGSGKHMNRSAINSDGNNSSSISLSAISISFFKKIG